MPSDPEETIPVAARDRQEPIHSTLELHVRQGREAVQILPFHRANLELHLDGGAALRFRLEEGEVHYRNETSHLPCYKDGVSENAGRLEVGNFLEVEGARILLWDRGRAEAYLKGYSPPYVGQIWPLAEGNNPIGRPGRRDNLIQLDHPTVSREHASVQWGSDGYRLLAESQVNQVWLDGAVVAAGQAAPLRDGNLLELGSLVFRFHWPGQPDSVPADLGFISVQSLGTFEVRVGDQPIPPKEWRTQHARWLLAHLAYEWGRSLPVDRILEELWPESPPDKSRNNLNYTLSILRQTLRAMLPESFQNHDIILRSSSSIQIDLSLFRQHDVVELRRWLDQASQERSRGGSCWQELMERAVLNYTGPFLSDCYLEWVLPVRQALEIEILDAAKALLQSQLSEGLWERAGKVASKALLIDPFSQAACLGLMQSLRHRNSQVEALKIFESFRKNLHKEMQLEPDMELLLEQQRLLSAL